VRSAWEGGRRADRLPRRATDRVEDAVAWLLITAGLLAVLLIGTVTSAVYRTGMERAAVEAADRHQVPAELLGTGAPGVSSQRVHTARWWSPNGVARTGRVPVQHNLPAPVVPGQQRSTAPAAGRQLLIWVNAQGTPTRPPTTAAGAAQAAVAVAVALSVVALLTLVGAWTSVRALTNRLNYARWEREWARVGPRWSRQVR
jgi:hypothetical protein